MSSIQDQCNELRAREEPFVLATVVAYKSPQSAKPGSKAIIKNDGSQIGWVGGGCVQPIVLREAKQALQTGQPKLLTISPDAPREDWKGVESYRMTCEGGGSLEIYLEPFVPKPQLVIVGRSPVAQTVAHLGHLLDFKVVVADPEADNQSFPEADVILTDLGATRSHINDSTYVVVATMGNGDEEGLSAVVGTRPKYLGLVASEKKSKGLFEYLLATGTTPEDIGVITCPAGIELGSETLPEIALSVAAEITRLRRASAAEPSEPKVAIDPICGMSVDVENAKYTSVVNNETIYFCCLRCKETFDHPQISQIHRIN
ncbi:MAG TPA: XdhC family protein [Pyrinomonadaceae bacterium]|jgi:xanthine dehydrogenase accessory factor|nr:XdhC family protein [Pyrinomonadaceae bacterium]